MLPDSSNVDVKSGQTLPFRMRPAANFSSVQSVSDRIAEKFVCESYRRSRC
jgi:hypothetical protein